MCALTINEGESEEEGPPICSIEESEHWILLDSGSGLAACPPDFARDLGARPSSVKVCCEAATGDSVRLQGERRVSFGFGNVELERSLVPQLPQQRSTYLTRAVVERHGPTAGCPACMGQGGRHTSACRARLEEALEEERKRAAVEEPRGPEAAPVGPAAAPAG